MTMPSAAPGRVCPVMHQDRPGDHRRRRPAIPPPGSGSAPRWRPAPPRRCIGPVPQGMGVPTQKQGPRTFFRPVFAHRLGDGQDMRFVETAAQRAALVAAGAESDPPGGVVNLGALR